MIGKKSFVLATMLLASFWASAQTKVLLSSDNKNIVEGDIISVELIIEGETDAELVKIENIDSFNIESQGTSTSFKYINGHSSREKVINYELSPKGNGKNEIFLGPAIVNVGGTEVKSNYLVFNIAKSNTQTKGKGAPPAQEFYFLTVELDKEELYVNQKTTLNLKFYNSVEFAEANLITPDSKSFWLEQNGKQRNSREVINGKAYKVTTISYFFTPLLEGNLSLDGFAINGLAILPDNDGQGRGQRQRLGFGFDSFFNDSMFRGGGKRRRVNIKAPALNIQIKKLPGTQNGEVFDGVVGKFNIKELDFPKNISSDDSITFSFTVSGDGNLNLLEFESLGNDFKIYKDKDETIPVAGGELFQTRQLTYLLIPQKSGRVKIPEFRSKYFDPSLNMFKDLIVGGGEVNVSGNIVGKGAGPQKITRPSETREQISNFNKEKGSDELPILEKGLYEIPEGDLGSDIVATVLRYSNIIVGFSFFISLFFLVVNFLQVFSTNPLKKLFNARNDTELELKQIFIELQNKKRILVSDIDLVLKLFLKNEYSVIRNINITNLSECGLQKNDIDFIKKQYLLIEEKQFSIQKEDRTMSKDDLKKLKDILFKYSKKSERSS